VKWKEAWEGCRGRRGVEGELWWGGDDVRAGVAEVGCERRGCLGALSPTMKVKGNVMGEYCFTEFSNLAWVMLLNSSA
jgi:hypothetical protein